MLDIADTSGDGLLDYDEFVAFVSVNRSEEAEVRRAFTAFDADGDGKLSPHDLLLSLTNQGQKVSLEECFAMVSNVNSNSSVSGNNASGMMSVQGGFMMTGGQMYIHYNEFRTLMTTQRPLDPGVGGVGSSSSVPPPTPQYVATTAPGGFGGGFGGFGGHGGGGAPAGGYGGDTVVVLVAHVLVDEETAFFDAFEERLCTSGLRLRKLGRTVPDGGDGKLKLVGGGMRTFRLDLSSHEHPHLLTWRKRGLKRFRGARGSFDLRQLTDVVAGAPGLYAGYNYAGGGGDSYQPVLHMNGGIHPELQIHLLSPAGTLSLEARSPEEQRSLLDGFRRLRSALRTSPAALAHRSTRKTKNKSRDGPGEDAAANPMSALGSGRHAALAAQEARLVQAFSSAAAASRGDDGFLDPVSLGHTLNNLGVRLTQQELQGVMQRVGSSPDGCLDYRSFASEVTALGDPALHAKQALERSVLDALLPRAQRSPIQQPGAPPSPGATIDPFTLNQALAGLSTGMQGGEGPGQSSAGSVPVLEADLIQFAVGEASLGGGGGGGVATVDVAKFARVAAGLDPTAEDKFRSFKQQKAAGLAQQVHDRYFHAKRQQVESVLERYGSVNFAAVGKQSSQPSLSSPFQSRGGGGGGGGAAAASDDGSSITPGALGQALNELQQGTTLPREEVAALLKATPQRKDGTLKWREGSLVSGITEMMVSIDESRWALTFERWDRNGDGSLTLRELERALKQASSSSSTPSSPSAGSDGTSNAERPRGDVERLLRGADVDLDGNLSMREFLVVMKAAELQGLLHERQQQQNQFYPHLQPPPQQQIQQEVMHQLPCTIQPVSAGQGGHWPEGGLGNFGTHGSAGAI